MLGRCGGMGEPKPADAAIQEISNKVGLHNLPKPNTTNSLTNR